MDGVRSSSPPPNPHLSGPPATESEPATSRPAATVPARNESSMHANANDDRERERATIAQCQKCGAAFGEFFNGWRKVTGSYYLPSFPGGYSIPGVHAKGKGKPASNESALAGCTIQPLVCNQCDDTLGIVVTRAPESQRAYSGRDFFKLPKISLRSEVTGTSVDAIIEDAYQGRGYSEDQPVPLGAPMEPTEDGRGAAVATTSSTTTPMSMPSAAKSHEESRRHDHAPPRLTATHALPQKPAVQDREAAHAAANRHHERVVPLASPVNGHLQANGLSNPGGYPSNLAVKLDAIDRLQTQVNLNRATLESCTRDISKLDGMVTRLQQSFAESFDLMRVELHNSRQHVAAATSSVPRGDGSEDHALEVLSVAVADASTKASEVDSLKIQLEIVKRKIRRLEERHDGSPAQGGGAPYPAQTREHSMHHTPIAQQAMTPTLRHQTPPSRPEARTHSHGHGHHPYHPHPQYTPEGSHQPHSQDAEAAAGGWVSVNPTAKRGLPNGIDGRSDADGTPIGSPKRPKLAPLEPRHAYEAAPPPPGPGPIRFERTDTDESTSISATQSQSQIQTQPPSQSQLHSQPQPHSQYRRTESNESYPDSTNLSTFVPYSADLPPEESWRPESQRIISGPAQATRSPGRGRGRGRGGRPRKSLPVEVHTLSTPEWEKDTWTGSQIGPDGYYHPGRGGLVRRGSGGAQGRPPMPQSPGSTIGDPYGHTKKTRTKPIRNSDGVLIRKDGRPDMRSQSSAANLRKVHARKEEEKRMEGGPSSGLATGVTSADGHSPDSHGSFDMEPNSTQEKRDIIMKQMFPNGVDEHRDRLYGTQFYSAHSTSHSPSELKPGMARSDGSAQSERGSRASSEDERMDDRQGVEESAEARPRVDGNGTTAPQHKPLGASRSVFEPSASTPTLSPSTLPAPSTATLSGTVQAAS